MNKLLVLFFIVIALLFEVALQFVQSGKFASMVSEKLSKTVVRKFNCHFSFENLEVRFFPPATIFKNVSLKSIKSNGPMMKADSIGVHFEMLDFFFNKITVEKIKITDGEFVMSKFPVKNIRQMRKFKISDLFRLYRDEIIKKIPVKLKKIEFERVSLFVGEENLNLSRLKMGLFREILQLDLTIEEGNIFGLAKKLPEFDSLELSAYISEQKVRIKSLLINDKLTKYRYEGDVFDHDDEIYLKGALGYYGRLEKLLVLVKKIMPDFKFSKGISGLADIRVNLQNSWHDPDMDFKIKLFKFIGPWVLFDEVDINGYKKGYSLDISLFEGRQNNSRIKLAKPIFIGNIRDASGFDSISFNLQEASTDHLFHYIKDVLGTVKGRMNGDLDVFFKKDNTLISVKDGFQFNQFVLEDEDGGKTPVLSNDLIIFQKGDFNISGDGTLKLDIGIVFGDSDLKASGIVADDSVNIKVESTQFDLEKFGPISGTSINGVGKISLKITGPADDVNFIFDAELDKFSMLDIYFGSVKGNLKLELEKSILFLSRVECKVGDTIFMLNGLLKFENDGLIDLDVAFLKGNYEDSVKIYSGLFPDDFNFLEEIRFEYEGDARIYGPLNVEKLDINGRLKVENIVWGGEIIDQMNTTFKYGESSIKLKKMSIRKKMGILAGEILYDIEKKKLNYNVKMDGMKLDDFQHYKMLNLGYDGQLSGEFHGTGTGSNFRSNGFIKIHNGHIGNFLVDDSIIIINNTGSEFHVNGNMFGEMIKLDSFFDLGDLVVSMKKVNKIKKSHLNLVFATEDIKLFAGMLSGHNIKDSSLKGRIYAKLESQFSFSDWNDFKLMIDIDDLLLKKNSMKIRIDEERNGIIIDKGIIKRWDILLDGNGYSISSKAEGDFNGELKILQHFNLDAGVLEILGKSIQKASGMFRGDFSVIGGKKGRAMHFESSADDLYFKIDKIPGVFNKVNYSMTAEKNMLLIHRLNAVYGKGTVNIDGSLLLPGFFPEIDLSFGIIQSQIPFLKKSGMVVSGKGKLTGTDFPYFLQGDFSVLHGEIIDDISELYKIGRDITGVNKFMPTKSRLSRIDLLKYDLGVNIFNPVYFKNNLVDMWINGGVDIVGTMESPIITGKLMVPTGKGKFFFRGHEFVLDTGSVILERARDKTEVNLKFTGSTVVDKYKVRLDVTGSGGNSSIKLSAEPPLIREDIVSLLAMGITSDVSRNLSEADLQSVTSLGLGSLVVEQLKLNQGLNSSLGLQLTILPEFSTTESSMLQMKSGEESPVSNARLRTATKVKVRKKVSDKVNVSISSTIGGSLGQKQEMNLDYNFNNNLSLKGIYEVKTSEEDGASSSNSAGFDFIFRRTFK